MKKTIVLCGFMACGKSSVARRLNFFTHRKLVDTDEYIETQANMTISDIFSTYGEDYFRDLEFNACNELTRQERLVIATGGGALTFERNVNAIRDNGCQIILIDTSLETIKERLRFDTKRPLLQCENRMEVIENLYNKRMPLYRKASTLVVDGNQSLDCIAHDIMTKTGIL